MYNETELRERTKKFLDAFFIIENRKPRQEDDDTIIIELDIDENYILIGSLVTNEYAIMTRDHEVVVSHYRSVGEQCWTPGMLLGAYLDLYYDTAEGASKDAEEA